MKIVISYRREDTAVLAASLRDRLVPKFGAGNVFMDIDSKTLGTDFRKVIGKIIDDCDVMLAVIGPDWHGPVKDTQRSRLDDETDWVRIEIESALKRDIPIIPLLVDGRRMPQPGEMPASMRDFSYRSGTELNTGLDFKTHTNRIARAIRELEKKTDLEKTARHEPGLDASVLENVPLADGIIGAATTMSAEEIPPSAVPVVPSNETAIDNAEIVTPGETSKSAVLVEVERPEIRRGRRARFAFIFGLLGATTLGAAASVELTFAFHRDVFGFPGTALNHLYGLAAGSAGAVIIFLALLIWTGPRTARIWRLGLKLLIGGIALGVWAVEGIFANDGGLFVSRIGSIDAVVAGMTAVIAAVILGMLGLLICLGAAIANSGHARAAGH